MVHTFNPKTQRQRLMDVCGLKAQPGQHSEFQNNQGYIEGLCHKTQDGEGKRGREKRKRQTGLTLEAEMGVMSIL